MYKLINKLDEIIHTNYTDNFNKIEKIIKNNNIYNELDMIEQELIIEDAFEKYTEITNNKKNLLDIPPSYRDVKELMKNSGYKFGNTESSKISENNTKLEQILTEGEIMSDSVKSIMLNKPTKKDLERRSKIFQDTKIKSANMPAQKSDEWLLKRVKSINGSECGTVLNKNKYQAQYTFILDKVLGSVFKGNAATYHGNIFEDAVRMIYEYNNDVHTEEFSSMPHSTNPILAASPDGIVSPYCRDMKTPTQLVGRMLEIKCPTMRKINYIGNIKDTICPIYYWCQIQQQLECLDLDECDFIQCNIERYYDRKEWLEDTHLECDYKSKKYNNLRGIIIELIPYKLDENEYNEKGYYSDMTIWTKTKCLFPPKIDMSLKELDEWILTELDKFHIGFTLRKIIYWRLKEQNCTLILRDREWFSTQLPIYNKIWEYVEYLRLNLNVIEKWKIWIDLQLRKYNDKVMMKLDMLIEDNEKNKLINNNNLDINNDISINIKENSENNIKKKQVEKVKRKYVKKNI
jgi:putative phage-type endonuclease